MNPTACQTQHGLRLSVYRNAELTTDCTLNGITARHTSVTLVGVQTEGNDREDRASGNYAGTLHVTALPRGMQAHPVREDAPAVILRYSASYYGEVRYMHLVPASSGTDRGMAGGNYAGTSDSRLPELLERLTGVRVRILDVHDRFE